jgi:hypothetical protein
MVAHLRETHTQDEGYDLFRRAIAERDGVAWAAVYQRYRPMLIGWVRQNHMAPQLGEEYGDIADQALARAWSALAPARFAEFPNLASLLGYLRSCVAAVIIDMTRARASRERAMQRIERRAAPTPEEMVLDRMEFSLLWRVVYDAVESEQERIVLVENFIYDLPPRTILARHPRIFDDVTDVYAAQRNLKARLQRNLALRQIREERAAG